jgi:hypothetical protein
VELNGQKISMEGGYGGEFFFRNYLQIGNNNNTCHLKCPVAKGVNLAT